MTRLERLEKFRSLHDIDLEHVNGLIDAFNGLVAIVEFLVNEIAGPTITPVLCPHGKATSFDVDGATCDELLPECDFCDECERIWRGTPDDHSGL